MPTVLIADSFHKNVEPLSDAEFRRVHAAIEKLRTDPTNPGLSMERVKQADSDKMWSARVNQDLRVILHRDGDRMTVLYAGHHDDAYDWARGRTVRVNERTGALQLVELPEITGYPVSGQEPEQGGEAREARPEPTYDFTLHDRDYIREQGVPEELIDDVYAIREQADWERVVAQLSNRAKDNLEYLALGQAPPEPVFAGQDPDFLLQLGLPEEWLEYVMGLRSLDAVYKLIDHIPEPVAERLLDLAHGVEVESPAAPKPKDRPEAHPDTLMTFVVTTDDEELQAMLSQPWEQWMLYLHPSQQRVAYGDFNGPVKVTGSAGTGKTVVAVHRARHLAAQGKRVLLTTFTNRLCDNMQYRLNKLCEPAELERITVRTMHSLALEVARARDRKIGNVSDKTIEDRIKDACPNSMSNEHRKFALEEWKHVVAAQGIRTKEEYESASRFGREAPLNKAARQRFWRVFSHVLEHQMKTRRLPFGHIVREAREHVEGEDPDMFEDASEHCFDAVVVDEIQDLGTEEIRLLKALCRSPENFMLVGDAGQRIYPGGTSLRGLGIETRGRSHRLTLNYRTSREIESFANAVRAAETDDLDGEQEEHHGVRSLLSGPEPVLRGFETFDAEQDFVLEKIREFLDDGIEPHEIAIFARRTRDYYHCKNRFVEAGLPVIELKRDTTQKEAEGKVQFLTMHGAKGLEFRVVFITACRNSAMPLREALNAAQDEKGKQMAEQRERNLLYVSTTRARDHLFITWMGTPSRYLGVGE